MKSNTIIDQSKSIETEKFPSNCKYNTMPYVDVNKNSLTTLELNSKSFANHPYKHLVSDINNVSIKTFKNFLTLTYKGLYYCKYNLKSPPQSLITSKQVKLPSLQGSLFGLN